MVSESIIIDSKLINEYYEVYGEKKSIRLCFSAAIR